MRTIGHLETERAARTFGDWLYVQGVKNHVEEDGPHWLIWVEDEDRLDEASRWLGEFRTSPADAKYTAQAKAAPAQRQAEQEDQAKWEKRLRDRRHLFRPVRGYGFGPLTFALIVACVIIFVLMKFGREPMAVKALLITNVQVDGDYLSWNARLPELRSGQIWRLFTPMLIHFNILHILFNMLWLKDLGSMIEARQSTLTLALLALVTAAGSNLAQYFWAGPMFGGMSGVVYALLGYVWMRGKYDPASGLFVPPPTVTMMLIWFVAGWTGILGPIANMAHGAGLVLGMAWGYFSSWRYRR
jgi:GlpG protein